MLALASFILLVVSCAEGGLFLRTGFSNTSAEWPEAVLGRPLAYDVGMNNGRDTMELLRSGHRVVAIEANPVLVDQATKMFAKFINAGQLRIVHGVLSSKRDNLAGSVVPFYVSKVGGSEWSSLIKSVGCRKSYKEPSVIDETKCDIIQVKVVSCAGILREFGTPFFLKLDIEGHEMSCLQELSELISSNKGRLALPQYVAMEFNPVTSDFLPKMVKLGYGRVKTVDQSPFGDWSGPYGELAQDIEAQYAWHDMSSYKTPTCTSWCDFHVGFGPVSMGSTQPYLNRTQMQHEIIRLADEIALI